jgi:hypothetical protein
MVVVGEEKEKKRSASIAAMAVPTTGAFSFGGGDGGGGGGGEGGGGFSFGSGTSSSTATIASIPAPAPAKGGLSFTSPAAAQRSTSHRKCSLPREPTEQQGQPQQIHNPLVLSRSANECLSSFLYHEDVLNLSTVSKAVKENLGGKLKKVAPRWRDDTLIDSFLALLNGKNPYNAFLLKEKVRNASYLRCSSPSVAVIVAFLLI